MLQSLRADERCLARNAEGARLLGTQGDEWWCVLKPILAERDHITAECDSHKSRSIRTQVRGALNVPADAYSATLEQLAFASDIAQKWLEGQPPRRVIVVPGKLVNLVP